MNSARISRTLETEILQEAKDYRRAFQKATKKDNDLGRGEEIAAEWHTGCKMKGDDWRSADYWCCENNKIEYIEKLCISCRQMKYFDILKKMQDA